MCGGGVERGFMFAMSGGDPTTLHAPPRPPRFSQPKTTSEAEKRRMADERARLERFRAQGAFGLSDSFITGGSGLSAAPASSTKTLLGS